MADRVGQHLGNYRLVALLGQGSYAQVYLGQHVRLPLQVAIKVLHTHLTGREAEHFQQEAETIARLMRPSIVRILDYDVQAGVPFLVMDYAPHGSLRRRYPKGTVVPLPQLVSYVKQIADALQYAHEQKFIHRDVKPENMLLGRHQELLLSDFGLAALAHSSASLSTQEAMGTLPYMAPEQIEGHPRAASDQYALGVVVYEWLCGSRPFEGSFSEVMVQHLSLPPPPLRERLPTIPGEVEQVALKTLAKDPRQRFACVQDFALALEVASTAVSTGSTRLMLASGHPLEAHHTIKHHLPTYLTPLLGREQEVVEACSLLRRPDVRLVTLTGTGGIGKTRLAVQLANELLTDFAGGVYFVSLAPLSDSELVIPAIAQTLAVKESRAGSLMDLLKSFLKDKHVLLVLDNFEQLLPAAPHVADLLTSCSHLKILVTSRATLHIHGEHEFLVSPLAVPDLTHLPEQEVLSQYAAVTLFLQCAQAVKPAFQLTSTNARPIAEICAHLDGLPLAIELAAARIKLLPPEALLVRLGKRMTVLTSGSHDAPARHQTLRRTIKWSYDLLDAQERRLFRWLSIFVGGCTLEAAEVVCDEATDVAMDVLEGVSSFIDKSLLQQTELEGNEPRLVMLETIREYGLEVLQESGEAEMSHRAHAQYYLALAEEAEPHLRGTQQVLWWKRLEREQENLRAALSWLIGQEEGELALRLSGALWWFWNIRGYWSEGGRWLEAVLGLPQAQGRTVRRAKALRGAGVLAHRSGHGHSAARSLFEESVAISRELADKRGLAEALDGLARSMFIQNDYIAARRHQEESLALAREVGDSWLLASILRNWGNYVEYTVDFKGARLFFQESVSIFRELQDQQGLLDTLSQLVEAMVFAGEATQATALAEESLALARALDNGPDLIIALYWIAVIQVFQGDTERAVTLLEESLALAREVGDKYRIGAAQGTLGALALHRGQLVQAETWVQEALALSKELRDKIMTAEVLAQLGEIRRRQGDLMQAKAVCTEGLLLAREVGNHYGTGWNLIGLARIAADEGQLGQAARLFGAADPWLRPGVMDPLERADYERDVEGIRARLGEQAFADVWAQGHTMRPEQALAANGQVTLPAPTPTEPLSTSPTSPANYPAGLSAREVEVLRLVAQGMTNEQVAEQLVISPRTVNSHLTAIYGKIGVTSRSAATRYAFEHELV
jgi:predicted ATPase/DNA-binding CsgD family transcriptional regulator